MRIVVAVVVGVVLASGVHAASAAEAKRQRSENCLDSCNFAFEKCQAGQSSKSGGRCNIEAVKCKNACPYETVEEPAVPTEKSHGRCIDACRLVFKKCSGQAENKHGGNCAADDVRCEQACPKPPPPPPEMVEVPPPAGSPPGTPPLVVPAPVATARPKRAGRVEGAAAPAPVSATPAVVPVPVERPVGSPPAVRSEPAVPPAAAASAEGVVHPVPKERGFFGTLGCFFVSCEPAGSTPCLKQCAAAYDECHVRESKRGGECNTRLMSCRQGCSNAAPAAEH